PHYPGYNSAVREDDLSDGRAYCFTPALRLADAEAGEGRDVHLASREDRLDGLLRVLHRRLLDEHDILVERADAALDDLRDGLLPVATLRGDLLRDPALLLAHVRGRLVPGDVLGTGRGDLLRDVLGDLFVGRVELDEHTEGRRQVPVGLVQVGGHVAAVEQG